MNLMKYINFVSLLLDNYDNIIIKLLSYIYGNVEYNEVFQLLPRIYFKKR